METPCKSICQVDRVRGLCIGCGRTLAEITQWRELTDGERRVIMDGLGDRLRTLTPHQQAPRS